LWPLEVGNVLLVAERHRRILKADSARFLALLGELPIIVDDPFGVRDIPVLVALGRDHGLSAYEATYLRLAMRERLPIATRDDALRTAARAVGVSPFTPARR
jgi:predicted nucleic acid-binding protein